jgi:exonuclease VII large subunit
MDSSKQNQGMFTDKPLTTPGGRQEAINKTKESWNENVADPAKRTLDKAQHRMDENTGAKQNEGKGMFTDKPLTTPEGRQEAVNKTKESWNENVADPARQTMDKVKHSMEENKEDVKDKTGQEKSVLQDLKEKTNENIVEPMQRTYEKAKDKISETFSSTDKTKQGQQEFTSGQENKPLYGGSQGQQAH